MKMNSKWFKVYNLRIPSIKHVDTIQGDLNILLYRNKRLAIHLYVHIHTYMYVSPPSCFLPNIYLSDNCMMWLFGKRVPLLKKGTRIMPKARQAFIFLKGRTKTSKALVFF